MMPVPPKRTATTMAIISATMARTPPAGPFSPGAPSNVHQHISGRTTLGCVPSEHGHNFKLLERPSVQNLPVARLTGACGWAGRHRPFTIQPHPPRVASNARGVHGEGQRRPGPPGGGGRGPGPRPGGGAGVMDTTTQTLARVVVLEECITCGASNHGLVADA